MSVPAVALRPSPPGSPFAPCYTPTDYELSLRICASTTASSSGLPALCSMKCRGHGGSVFHLPTSSVCGSGIGAGCSRSLPSVRVQLDRHLPSLVVSALRSCLDYNSPRSPLAAGGGGAGIKDFAFDLEQRLGDSAPSCEPYARQLLSRAQSRHKIFNEDIVQKAFYEAERAHRGQMRVSGDPYLQHCVETAVLLARIGATATVVAAGLLHDAVDDSFMDYNYIIQQFGASVADLVEGVSKLSHLSKLARQNNTASRIVEADRLHTMFLAMEDARAVLIKLADRLHNMMTLESLPLVKQQRFAKETLEIFVPLANRLGILSWKEQLENLCFKYLYPEQYKELSTKLLTSYNSDMIAAAIKKLEQGLKTRAISYHAITGRHKSLYSIYNKMLRKNLTMDEIHDIHGLRLIVENKRDCFEALDVVHCLWPRVPEKLKDYITNPKPNGYQSVHTVVMSEDKLPLEVQIRTREMHLQAEFGIAAHWRYKEGGCECSSFVPHMVEWVRWVVTWQCETMDVDCPSSISGGDAARLPCPFPSHLDDCPYSYSKQCNHSGPIVVILLENEKMSVQELPPNSTVTDLLERVGGECSGQPEFCIAAREEEIRVNCEPISGRNQKLKMGDVVKLTSRIPQENLTDYREEFQRIFDNGLAVSKP